MRTNYSIGHSKFKVFKFFNGKIFFNLNYPINLNLLIYNLPSLFKDGLEAADNGLDTFNSYF